MGGWLSLFRKKNNDWMEILLIGNRIRRTWGIPKDIFWSQVWIWIPIAPPTTTNERLLPRYTTSITKFNDDTYSTLYGPQFINVDRWQYYVGVTFLRRGGNFICCICEWECDLSASTARVSYVLDSSKANGRYGVCRNCYDCAEQMELTKMYIKF
jgi:hypothetical protein